MLNLSQRKCFLGIRSSTKSKHHDGTEVKVLDIDLEQIELEKHEVNFLLGEPRAWESLFNTVNGKSEPFLKTVKALQLVESIDQAFVALTYGVKARVIELKDVKLSKVTLDLMEKGKVFMSCKVRGPAVLDDHFGDFMDKLGDPIECEMRFEQPGQQKDLPFNTVGANESATPSIGTPTEEREKARVRDREIAAQNDTVQPNGAGKKKSRSKDPVVKAEKVDTSKRRKASAGAALN